MLGQINYIFVILEVVATKALTDIQSGLFCCALRTQTLTPPRLFPRRLFCCLMRVLARLAKSVRATTACIRPYEQEGADAAICVHHHRADVCTKFRSLKLYLPSLERSPPTACGLVAFYLAQPMFTLSVKSNVDKVRKSLTDVAKNQLPFAIARALTWTGNDATGLLTTALPRQLDRPTPFTMKAFATKPATKQRLESKVFIRPAQWKYLKYQIEGGVRQPAKRALIVPKELRLNQYGNMPKAAVKRLLAKAGVFSGTVDGVPGIYQRKGKQVQLLVSYANQVAYKSRLPFEQIGKRSVAKTFDKNFERSIDLALASLRQP